MLSWGILCHSRVHVGTCIPRPASPADVDDETVYRFSTGCITQTNDRWAGGPVYLYTPAYVPSICIIPTNLIPRTVQVWRPRSLILTQSGWSPVIYGCSRRCLPCPDRTMDCWAGRVSPVGVYMSQNSIFRDRLPYICSCSRGVAIPRFWTT